MVPLSRVHGIGSWRKLITGVPWKAIFYPGLLAYAISPSLPSWCCGWAALLHSMGMVLCFPRAQKQCNLCNHGPKYASLPPKLPAILSEWQLANLTQWNSQWGPEVSFLFCAYFMVIWRFRREGTPCGEGVHFVSCLGSPRFPLTVLLDCLVAWLGRWRCREKYENMRENIGTSCDIKEHSNQPS